MRKRHGQLLVGAILLVAVLAIIIPVMVMYVQNEAKWSVKQGQNTNAFQLAEGAVDRGYQKVIESTQTWKQIQDGQAIPCMSFNCSFTDLSGGTYAVSVTSGPNSGEVTIVGVGRDKMNKEVRALRAVYANQILNNISIQADNGVSMNGNNIQVEWGAVSSPKTISILSKTYPSYWSAASIDKDTNGSTPQNCDSPDCWWWHSYYTALPPTPTVDFAAYKSSAIASGNDPCGRAYYQPGNFSSNCTSLTGKPYYIEGNWTSFRSAIIGSVIVRGNLSFHNGGNPQVGAYAATVPPAAWKQYCNSTAWAYYRATYDSVPPASPPCFGNINYSYNATGVTKVINPGVHGFMYVGGNLTLPNGGGCSDLLHGSMIVAGIADIGSNSHCRIYYDPVVAINILTANLNLVRQSWQDVTTAWPAALP
ncbi:MAG: hypothetical protein A2234_03045 [Elusimicrobia bacterium RIFOXYA2_FULL_58_8]|nr:MAG: hypothetical protein A2285_09370 [Elusimicrobia bacterium RIFOXYA12_FULL_57_11]OGS12977.1 MAG: hypothetical protein A2234_03045 [Elusimicrobia bacterium RIFOXYA2_FULL_58_8]